MEQDDSFLNLAIAYREHLLLRERLIGPQASCKPAWSMLIELLIAEIRQERRSVGTLSKAAGIKNTTALRWIDWLQDQKLIKRHPDPRNRLRVFIGLSVEGRKVVKAMLIDMVASFSAQ